MTMKFLVIVGYCGTGMERCWKRLRESQCYLWKSKIETFFETLFKANDWSFDLHTIGRWSRMDLGPSFAFDRQHAELLPVPVALPSRVRRRPSSRSMYLPVSSPRFLSDL